MNILEKEALCIDPREGIIMGAYRYYEVFDITTNALIVSGEAKVCAEKMGMERSAFYTLVYQTLDSKKPRFRIIVHGRTIRHPTRYKYRIETDGGKVIIGSSEECARKLGMNMHTFYSTICRCRQGHNKRYNVEIINL